MLKLRKILSHSPLLAQCQAVSGPCPWRSLLTLSTARSSPAKNPSKMFKQPTGTLSGGSVFARPRANMQGIQTGQPQSADYLFIVNHMLSSFAGCSSHTVQYVQKSDQIGHYYQFFIRKFPKALVLGLATPWTSTRLLKGQTLTSISCGPLSLAPQSRHYIIILHQFCCSTQCVHLFFSFRLLHFCIGCVMPHSPNWKRKASYCVFIRFEVP